MSLKRLGRAVGLMAASLAVLSAGCGKSAPKTHPAGGKVVYKDGAPLTGGAVQFQPVGGGPNLVGRIGPDGTFALSAMTETGPVPGGMGGRFRVTVLADTPKGQGGQPIHLTNLYTLKPDAPNDLTITVERAGKH